MNSIRSVAVVAFVVAFLAVCSMAQDFDGSLSICKPEAKDTVTAEEVEKAYADVLVIESDLLNELLKSSLDKFYSQLAAAGGKSAETKAVIVEHRDKVCEVVITLDNMITKVSTLLA